MEKNFNKTNKRVKFFMADTSHRIISNYCAMSDKTPDYASRGRNYENIKQKRHAVKAIKRFKHTILCLIVSSHIASFGKKNPQVHLIIIREWPKNNPPPSPSPPPRFVEILIILPWCILFDPIQFGTRVQIQNLNPKSLKDCFKNMSEMLH